MNKVMIIGCPGSGKSTFARNLHKKTHLPLYYLDMLWHKPDRTTISRDEFDLLLKEIIIKDHWIIDGNYSRTLEIRCEYCDSIFFLNLSSEECLKGITERIGKEREDMPWIENTLDEDFKQRVIDFKEKEVPKINKLLDKYKDTREIIVFTDRNQINKYLDEL